MLGFDVLNKKNSVLNFIVQIRTAGCLAEIRSNDKFCQNKTFNCHMAELLVICDKICFSYIFAFLANHCVSRFESIINKKKKVSFIIRVIIAVSVLYEGVTTDGIFGKYS